PGLSYRWLLNEFPNFIPADGRRFISQTTGNLYIAKTEASDLGNYSCFATSHMDFITKSVFSKFSRLSLAAEGQCSWIFPPSIKARFPADTYALAGQVVTLECFAFGK
ncbi:CNTN2 protein, partial [Buphagus erythrorhynchus]|nr:CNTN2 protein [Buphagus erythrorhynchus]